MSMRELAANGEPALAIIGGITCIEWLLRELLKTPVMAGTYLPGISDCLNAPLRINLPSPIRGRLRDILDVRNEATHGDPLFGDDDNQKARDFSRALEEVLQLGLDIYREAQRQLKLGLIDSPDKHQRPPSASS
jgi:hypothetical protein